MRPDTIFWSSVSMRPCYFSSFWVIPRLQTPGFSHAQAELCPTWGPLCWIPEFYLCISFLQCLATLVSQDYQFYLLNSRPARFCLVPPPCTWKATLWMVILGNYRIHLICFLSHISVSPDIWYLVSENIVLLILFFLIFKKLVQLGCYIYIYSLLFHLGWK